MSTEAKQKTKLVGFACPVELAQMIEAEAERQDRTVSSWLRQTIRSVLGDITHPPPQADASEA